MSSKLPLPIKPQYTIPRQNEEDIEDVVLAAIDSFVKGRSFRRIYMMAGFGTVVFAAWYMFKKFSTDKQPSTTVALSSVHDQVQIAMHDHLVEAPPEDEKVVIHCVPRGYFTPCIATAPLQLETFLRVANIPYEVSFCCESTNSSDTPFMTMGAKAGNDFKGCLRILGEKYDVDLEREASASRKTASHLVDVLLENQFAWAILIWRYVIDEGKSLKKIQPVSALGDEVVGEVAQQVQETTRYHPIGRLDKEEFTQTILQGIQDISAALGKHDYFLGVNPGLVDCHAFAILSQMMWNMPGSPFESHLRRFSNVVNYMKRMKESFWPDWNQLIQKPDEYDAIEALSTRDKPVSRRSSEEKLKRRKSSKSPTAL